MGKGVREISFNKSFFNERKYFYLDMDNWWSSCRILNIFPLGFEPESFSLANLAALSSPDPALVIYFNTHKVIFCYAENEVVLLTTILNQIGPINNQEVLPELLKSVKFWKASFGKTKKIKNIYLAGQINNELMIKQAVKNNFSISAKKLSMPVIIPPEISSNRLSLLTPLFGMAFSQRQRESGCKKITLIPAKIKEARKLFKFKKRVKLVLKLVIFLLLGFIALYSYVFLFC